MTFHCRSGSLTWHSGVVPADEIWIKIGGDKGGSTFKMSFQIVNVSGPNSLKNTVVFACFEADDSFTNLERTLPRVIHQIADLAKQSWR